jgi:GTPase
VLLVGNKTENEFMDPDYKEIYSLGLGEPVQISAEHGDGM